MPWPYGLGILLVIQLKREVYLILALHASAYPL